MLKSHHWSQHSLYQKNLLNSLKLLLNSYRDRIEEYSDLIDRLFYLNLDNAYKVLSPYYPNTGRPAKFQAEILRSLIAMVHLRIYSITKWVKKLKTDNVLAIICGFDPDDVPGIGTFYDFLNRFWIDSNKPSKVKTPIGKPKKPSNQQDKLPPKHPNVVKNIVNRILKGGKVSLGPQRVISLLFSEVAVKPSIKMGLIKPDLAYLLMALLWNLHLILMARNSVIVLRTASSTVTVKGFTLTLQLIGVGIDTYGRPICPLGLPMVNWGYNKNRFRIKWRCPVLGYLLIRQEALSYRTNSTLSIGPRLKDV